jgi:hypothetical protein
VREAGATHARGAGIALRSGTGQRMVTGAAPRAGLLDGCVPFPPEFADRYRSRGFWKGLTLGESRTGSG